MIHYSLSYYLYLKQILQTEQPTPKQAKQLKESEKAKHKVKKGKTIIKNKLKNTNLIYR